MQIQGEYTFEAPQEMVWRALRDPEVLGSILPGGQGIEQVNDNQYAGKLQIRVGPVQGVFNGNIQLFDIVEPDSYAMNVDGKGAPGFVKASGGLELATNANGHTHMTYAGTATVGGRIASVGQRLLDSSAKSIVRQSLEGLDAYLQAQVAAQEAALAAGLSTEEAAEVAAQAETIAYTPPSQAAVAANVAKDVADEFVPPQARPFVIGGLVLLVLFILYRLLRR